MADITYIRLGTEFGYLAGVLDAFSRKVIGRALNRMLEAARTVAAMQLAPGRRKPAPGEGGAPHLIHCVSAAAVGS